MPPHNLPGTPRGCRPKNSLTTPVRRIEKGLTMKKTSLLIAASSALTLAYAAAVAYVPADAQNLACGGETKSEKKDKKGEEKS